MLDLKKIIHDHSKLEGSLVKRSFSADKIEKTLESITILSTQRKEFITKRDQLKSSRNTISAKVAEQMKAGDKSQATELMTESKSIGAEIEVLDKECNVIEQKIEDILAVIPNFLDDSVPNGKSESENILVKEWGDKKQFSFTPLSHDVWADKTGQIDFDRASRTSGSRFVFLRGDLARLELALIQFMIDEHVSRGYEPISVPHLVCDHVLYGSGQFPKFKEDVYKIENENKYLIPTTEVPLASFYAGEIIPEKDLNISFCGHSINFRSEAGSYGRDTKGMIRQHQFHKIELFKFTRPEDSFTELDNMLSDAENILQKLQIPYRVMLLCSGDTGFCATKTFDIEAWLPGSKYTDEELGCYREISSCSNCLDFQARRSNIRFKDSKDKKNKFVHTLNGSGLAVGRTLIAIVENYQNDDGSITVPSALVPYLKKEKLCLPK